MFEPHGHCYGWEPDVIWLHALSDFSIASVFFVIPFLAVLYGLRDRIRMGAAAIVFALFFIACGATHALDIVTLWEPVYWLSGIIKLFTAMISWVAAFAFLYEAPIYITHDPDEAERAWSQLHSSAARGQIQVDKKEREIDALQARLAEKPSEACEEVERAQKSIEIATSALAARLSKDDE